jgi:hypothetical protein
MTIARRTIKGVAHNLTSPSSPPAAATSAASVESGAWLRRIATRAFVICGVVALVAVIIAYSQWNARHVAMELAALRAELDGTRTELELKTAEAYRCADHVASLSRDCNR